MSIKLYLRPRPWWQKAGRWAWEQLGLATDKDVWSLQGEIGDLQHALACFHMTPEQRLIPDTLYAVERRDVL